MVVAAIIVIVLLASETILGQFPFLRVIGNRGKVEVKGVGVYWDANCTNPVSSLDWGSVESNSVKNKTVFIRNEGNQPSSLFLNATNWNPSKASEYLTLTWDYNGYILYPHQTTRVTLTLFIASTIEGIEDFTFDIIIGVND